MSPPPTNVLDRVLTNMNSLYKIREVAALLGLWDQHVVGCPPLPEYATPVPKPQVFLTYSKGQNKKAMFADAMMKVDWSPLYHMSTRAEPLHCLQFTIISIPDMHMPMRTTSQCSTDTPWITPYFKDLIKKRQKAFQSKDKNIYRSLRNKVNRV